MILHEMLPLSSFHVQDNSFPHKICNLSVQHLTLCAIPQECRLWHFSRELTSVIQIPGNLRFKTTFVTYHGRGHKLLHTCITLSTRNPSPPIKMPRLVRLFIASVASIADLVSFFSQTDMSGVLPFSHSMHTPVLLVHRSIRRRRH